MGKRAKGLDAVRQNNQLKKAMLSSCKKYAEQLEKENYDLKNDPNTVIGQFIGQFRELYGQNQRLSVLGASLLRKLGEKVVLTKEEMESFQNQKINIKWELPEGVEKIEDAKEFVFTYELQEAPPQGQPVQQTEQPGIELTPQQLAAVAVVSDETLEEVVTAPEVVTVEYSAPEEADPRPLQYSPEEQAALAAEDVNDSVNVDPDIHAAPLIAPYDIVDEVNGIKRPLPQ